MTKALQPVIVSPDGHNFTLSDGKPFFWLADTGWTMVTRLRMSEVDEYLADRKKKGFTVIQLILVPWDARQKGNLAGVKPYINDDMAQPNPIYFDHVEAVLDRIQRAGMYPAVVPFWLAGLPEPGPEEISRHIAYAAYLGKRFGNRPIFWLLGADRWPDGWAAVIRAFATELERASPRKDMLLTHHPAGGQTSSRFFHAEPWLDFNMLQSGHNVDLPHYKMIEGDYAKQPAKPTLDGEPGYENITNALAPYTPGVRLLRDFDIRRQAYQAVFAGAAGHTYGACEVYEFHTINAGRAQWTVGAPWRVALHFPGSTQVGYLRKLIESRSPETRIPDRSLIVSPNPDNVNARMFALRDRKGRYAYIYSPAGEPFEVDTAKVSRGNLFQRWFDPRTGKQTVPVQIAPVSNLKCTPPVRGWDWVLVITATKN